MQQLALVICCILHSIWLRWAGPSTPPAHTPAPLTLEQQHITTVEGIVPTLQNIVAMVNLDFHLDFKTIACIHTMRSISQRLVQLTSLTHHKCTYYPFILSVAFCHCHYTDSQPQNNSAHLCFWEDGCDWSQEWRWFAPWMRCSSCMHQMGTCPTCQGQHLLQTCTWSHYFSVAATGFAYFWEICDNLLKKIDKNMKIFM